jgi:carboxyl-terminal processing protease
MTNQVSEELAQQVETLVAQGMRGLVLDLRGNAGGLVEEGLQIAQLFLDRGQIIATIKRRDVQVFRAGGSQPWPDLALAVLVDGTTASAAEVATAALQDHDRAIVVGTPTRGKGVVQQTYSLGGEVALRFTTGRWYAPSGRWIQRGAKPARIAPSSDGGRMLPAGSGIVPDTIVTPATPTVGERAYGLAVARNRSEYEDALSVIAAHLVRTGAVSSEATPVTPRMRSMLFQRLQGSGLQVSDTLYAAAAAAVDRDLGVVMVRAAFGTAAAVRRQIGHDHQVRTAGALLAAYPGRDGVLSLDAARLVSAVAAATE